MNRLPTIFHALLLNITTYTNQVVIVLIKPDANLDMIYIYRTIIPVKRSTRYCNG